MQFVTHEKGYYLPLSYNDDKIVLLVRDPKYLFAYWGISEEKRQNFINQFGQDSWNNSRPVIKLTNVSMGWVRFIDIDDFANNWYIKVDEANCAYSAEIGRLFNSDFFVSLAISNTAKAPTNKPSDNRTPMMVADYRDLTTAKEIQVKVQPDLGKYEHVPENKTNPSSLGLSGVSSDSFIK